MHRDQADACHAQPGQMIDDDRGSQARVGAPALGRNTGVAQSHAPDMRLVDHRLVIGRARRPVIRPVK